MTLLDVVRLLKRSWRLIVVMTLVGIAVAAGFTMTRPTLYQAASTGYLIANTPGSGNVYDAQTSTTFAANRAQQYLPLASTKAVSDEMATILEGSGVSASSIGVEIVPGSNILRVTAVGTSPEQSQARANAGVQAMANVIHRMETLNPSAADANEVGTFENLPQGGTATVALVSFEPAAPPAAPFSPNWERNLAAGLLGGLVLGCAVAVLRKVLDSRIHTSRDIEQLTDAGILGVLPHAPELTKQRKSQTTALGIASEPLRKLRTNLRFVRLDNPPRAIVVTSPNPSEGKSTVALNLARVLAQSGQKTVVVDADLRKPRIGQTLGLDSRVGLTQVLTGDVDLETALQSTDDSNLQVLTAGRVPPNPSEVVGSQHMAALIQQLRDSGLMVIIDAPPLLPVTDAGLLTAAADGAILVVRVGKTFKDQVEVAIKQLGNINDKLLGVVMNGATKRQMSEVVYGYGKSYGYYRDYYGEDGKKKRRSKKSAGSKSEQSDPTNLVPFSPSQQN